MDYHYRSQQASLPQDFVIDLLSGSAVPGPTPPIPPRKPPRQRQVGNQPFPPSATPLYCPNVEQEPKQPEYNTLGRLRQALPPSDDDRLVVDIPSVSVIESLPVETYDSDLRTSSSFVQSDAERHSSQNSEMVSSYISQYSSMSMKRTVLPSVDDFDACVVIRTESKITGCGDDMLLASVPYQTLRIEPSPALTLDNRRSAGRSRINDIDRPCSGRLRSTGSVENDLESIRDISQPAELKRCSSTPLLVNDDDDDQSEFQPQSKQLVADTAMVQRLNMFFGESKSTVTALEASVYKSLVMGPVQSKTYDMTVAAAKTKKSASAWSLASKLASSHASLSGKLSGKKTTEEKDVQPQSFQKTKGRRSLRGRMAALVRQRLGAHTSSAEAGTNDSSKWHTPKTFGIPLEQCHMSSSYEGVPLIVDVCVSIIQDRGLDSQGIYRIPGNAGTVQDLQERLDKRPDLNVDGELWREVNVVSSLLKLFFRKLPKSLIPPEFYSRLIAANRSPTSDERMIGIKEVVDELPDCNYMTLRFLMEHLNAVSSMQDVNKMDAYNLSIMFGPALIRPQEDSMLNMLKDMADQGQIVESLIKHYEWFFDQSPDGDASVPVDCAADSTSPHLLPNAENLVELQVAREAQAQDMVACFEQYQMTTASSGSGSSKSYRKRSRSLKDVADRAVDIDAAAQSSSGVLEVPTDSRKLKGTVSSSNLDGLEVVGSGKAKRSQSSRKPIRPADIRVVQSSTSLSSRNDSTPTRDNVYSTSSAENNEEVVVEIKRYPAHHYDANRFFVAQTPPVPLERNSMKSASAECLDTLNRKSPDVFVEPVDGTRYAAATLHMKPVPKPRPPLPPKPKPAAPLATADLETDAGFLTNSELDTSENTGIIDSKFKEQLSAALQQWPGDVRKASRGFERGMKDM